MLWSQSEYGQDFNIEETVSEIKQYVSFINEKSLKLQQLKSTYERNYQRIRQSKVKLKQLQKKSAFISVQYQEKIYQMENIMLQIDQRKQNIKQRQRQIQNNRLKIAQITLIENALTLKRQSVKGNIQKTQQQLSTLINIQKIISHQLKNQKDVQSVKRSLSDQIQELKGSIRVYCRIRGLANSQQINYRVEENKLILTRGINFKPKSSNFQMEFQFIFDHIYSSVSSQQTIFQPISSLIQSSINGRDLCIFSYGQTGSGKTYTMEGKDSQQQAGIIPRSLNLIFSDRASKLLSNSYNQSQIYISICQVYNQKVKDLLQQGMTIEYSKRTLKMQQNIQQALETFRMACKGRSISSTLCNSQSSRSHLILNIQIKQVLEEQKNICNNLLFIDLAGSERVLESGVVGKQLKQAQFINKSLSELGSIIGSLKSRKFKPVFRNSKLGSIIQPYLQDPSRGKAVMIVNISPDLKDEEQSLNSLKFATRARQCTGI